MTSTKEAARGTTIFKALVRWFHIVAAAESSADRRTETCGFVLFRSLCKLVLRQQLLEVSGEQLFLHGEANPGSRLAHVCLDLTDILNVSAK